jgi:uncharacterized iron-regulated membrane protein
MTIKRTIFWSHLSVGIFAGIVIFLLSASGVLLTYERQIIAWAENSAVSAAGAQERLSADELAARAIEQGAKPGNSLIVSNGEETAVRVSLGRRQTLLLDPYTGAQLQDAGSTTKRFFSAVTAFHRWFALEGENSAAGRAITGAANLGFFFLVVSGIYLWWPRAWKWALVKTKVLFRRNLPTGKARDYNWHHVFGIWALIPLFAITLSGVVISYPWASDLVYQVYGEAPPVRRGPPRGEDPLKGIAGTVSDPVSLQSILDKAAGRANGWNRISLTIPQATTPAVAVTIDTGNGVQNDLKETYVYSRETGDVIKEIGPTAGTAGQKTRVFLRFLHTGEIYGIIGQTLAGLASLAALFLTYTGFALAYRRLIQPLFFRRTPQGN